MVVRPTDTTTYRLQAQSASATGAGEVTVQVQQPQKPVITTPPPVSQVKPVISFHAVPPSIPQGASSALIWGLQNAVAANISPQPGALHQTAGRVMVTPAETTTYVLTAQSKDGLTETASVTVTVTAGNVVSPPVVNPPVSNARTGTAMITVVHDHGGAMNASAWPSCYGALQVVNGMLRYSVAGSVDGRRDAFEIPMSQVQEISLNRVHIKNQPAFHIVIGGKHLNFVTTGMTAAQAVAELRSALSGR
jgi:hypothetical protein